MQWSAEIAMLDMWRAMDKNVTNGEMQRFFREHLQAAFDADRKMGSDDTRYILHDRDYPEPTSFERE